MTDSRRIAWLVSALLLLIAGAAGGWGYHEHQRLTDLDFLQRRAALLQTENDRLRSALDHQEKDKARQDEIARRRPIEQAVVQIRGLHFAKPVIYDVLSRAGIKKVLEQKLSEQYSDQEFRNVATGLAAFGLLKPGYPLKEELVDLLGEQIAAFYDQHQHKLFMFEDASLQSAQNRIVLAHELTHALQDQNFGLLKMPLETKSNDDLALATSALIEGDATLTMSDYMIQNISLKTLRENLSGMFSQSMDQLQRAPRYLREMLVFPYLHGQEFCTALRSRGGYQAISDAFKNPPVSSSQILHPEKYLAEPREDPVPINFTDTTAMGQKAIADNVLGEMGIRIFLSEWGQGASAPAAAAGWRGDRYLVFEDSGNTELVWKTVWETGQDAAKFMEAVKETFLKRYGPITVTKKEGGYLLNKENKVVSLNLRDANSVVLIDATNSSWVETLEKKTP